MKNLISIVLILFAWTFACLFAKYHFNIFIVLTAMSFLTLVVCLALIKESKSIEK